MTLTQRVIIPRNWLFGRLSYITNNLGSMKHNKNNFTEEEFKQIQNALDILNNVLINKKNSSITLKRKINEKTTLVR